MDPLYFLDAESIRRQQSDAARNAHARMMAAVEAGGYADAPGRSCELVAEALAELLEGAGVRFADRRAAVVTLAIALWGGIAVVSAEAQREELEADGDDEVEVAPIFPWLAPAFNLVGAIADAITTTEPPQGSDAFAESLREQLADEGYGDDDHGGDDDEHGDDDL